METVQEGDGRRRTKSEPVIFMYAFGEASNDWDRRNAMIPQAGLAVLRLALAELAHHYGHCKLPGVEEPPQRGGPPSVNS